MKIAILTTKTTHHAYFVREILKTNYEIDIFIEKKITFKKYKISHSIDRKTTDFEKKRCFKDDKNFLKNFNKLPEYNSFNSKKFLRIIKKKNYNLIFVFGTGLINNDIIRLVKKKIYNFHGGNPELYRGLDSIYWSIFHNNYDAIVTTLHKLDKNFDTGKIFMTKKIPTFKNMKFYQIRYYNTNNCIKLGKLLISRLKNKKKIFLVKQKKIGKYYTAMPSELKTYCIKKFENYLRK